MYTHGDAKVPKANPDISSRGYPPDGGNGFFLINAVNNTLSVDKVDYYYFISYPEWNGSRIVHDPTFVAYADLAAGIFSVNTLILIGAFGVIIAVAVFFVIRRRK